MKFSEKNNTSIIVEIKPHFGDMYEADLALKALSVMLAGWSDFYNNNGKGNIIEVIFHAKNKNTNTRKKSARVGKGKSRTNPPSSS